MNNFCNKKCKHKEICRLDQEKTRSCNNSDEELDQAFNRVSGPLMGYTTEEICNMQGRKGDLRK